VKSAKDVPFGGFINNGHPHFCSKHARILGVRATKIRSRMGNSPWGFQILG